jgi:hypothetical protein
MYGVTKGIKNEFSALIKPFENLWPEYNTKEKFQYDFDYFIFAKRDIKQGIIDYLSSRIEQGGRVNQVTEHNARIYATSTRNEYTEAGPREMEGLDVNRREVDHPMYSSNILPKRYFDILLQLSLPPKFTEVLPPFSILLLVLFARIMKTKFF